MNKKIFTRRTTAISGERASLKQTLKWITEEMDYNNFFRLAHLGFYDRRTGRPFDYYYDVSEADDTPDARRVFLEYLAYKLLQNLETDDIEVRPQV